jgi:anaerobic selenocysteine-containing dehydrogenase
MSEKTTFENMSDFEIIIEEMKEEKKKPQSETLKRTKTKYYSKKKLDLEFMEQNRNKVKEYYTHNSERHQNKCKEYYLEHKQEIYDQAKLRRDKKKLDTVKAKLENIDIEQLARILIEARKTSLLD